MKIPAFQDLIARKGHELYRDMPWRTDTRPYYVLVSELMLQQTQVERVIPKFQAFIARFPDEAHLAAAPLHDVLVFWSGLGYNRRAQFLHEAAKQIVAVHEGSFPATKQALMRLPGVGEGTAGAILAYTFNQPIVFIETNIRTVYFHHFFPGGDKVSDAELIPLIEATLDYDHPREFYWAVMDYGTWLKKQGVGRVNQSQHYTRQTALKGSNREMRGLIVKALALHGDMAESELHATVRADQRFEKALAGLMRDGLVKKTGHILHLTK